MKLGSAYIRVSTSDQLEYSPESQLRLIKEYANRNNIIIYDEFIYSDEGISGRDVDKRPGFKKMISMAKQKPKPFDYILVYSTSRFARNHEQSIVYRSMLEKEYGIEVISITQPSIDKKTDMLTTAIYSIMDEWYSLDLSENVRRGMTQKALEGGHQTSPPFGYERKHKGDELTIVESEAEVIRFIFNEILNGTSKWGIARKLKTKGIKTKRGSDIDTRKLTYMLRNPVYKGYVRWTPNKKVHWDFKNKDTIIAKAKHTAIIEEDVFDKIQVVLDDLEARFSKRTRPTESTKHWLSGLIKCCDCGSSLSYQGISATKKYPAFRCGGYCKGRCSTTNFITVKEAEELTLDYFNSIGKDVNILFNTNISIDNDSLAEVDYIKNELKSIKMRLERAKQGFLNGVFEINEFKDLKASLEKEIKNKESKIDELGNVKIQYDELQKNVNNIYNILREANFTKDEKQVAVRSIIKKIVFSRKQGDFKIYF